MKGNVLKGIDYMPYLDGRNERCRVRGDELVIGSENFPTILSEVFEIVEVASLQLFLCRQA